MLGTEDKKENETPFLPIKLTVQKGRQTCKQPPKWKVTVAVLKRERA